MARIRDWVKRLVSTATVSDSETRDPLPFLPTTRESSSPEGLASYVQNYGLFGRLPVEIRQEIFVLAFGNRTLHVDLRYGPPLVRQSEEDTSHCGLQAGLRPDPSQRSTWQWFGCVCHRRAEWLPEFSGSNLALLPCDDACLRGLFCSCEDGESAKDCFIGALGWLLACHMSYQEGTDTMFSMNKFHFSSLDLQLNLPRLVSPHGLSRITSLELIWDFRRSRQKNPRRRQHSNLLRPLWESNSPISEARPSTDSPLHQLCEMVPEAFPHVQHLYISLQSHIGPPDPKIFRNPKQEVERVILGPIEDMVRQLGPGRDITIAVQLGGWEVLLRRYQDLHQGDVKLEMIDWLNGRFWKPLDDPHHEDLGYWLCSGWNDVGFMDRAMYEHEDYWGERTAR